MLLAATLCACNHAPTEVPVSATPPAPAPTHRPGGVELRPPGQGPGSAQTNATHYEKAPPSAQKPRDLELAVIVRDRVVERGASIPVIVEVTNTSKEHIQLVDAVGDLARRTRFSIVCNGQRTGCGPGVPAASSTARRRDVDLAPGESVAAELDLLLALQDTRAYFDGKVRLRALFQGERNTAQGGLQGWNTDPEHLIESKEFVIDISLPRWLNELGATDAMYIDMRNTALTFTAGAPDEEKIKATVATQGTAGYACLLFLTREMGGLDEQEADTARRALALLRACGDATLAALSGLTPPADPAVQMTLDVLAEDRDQRAGRVPDADVPKLLRHIATGEPDAGMFEVRFEDTISVEKGSFLLDKNGILTLVHEEGSRTIRECRQLPTQCLAELKAALVASRFAAWRHVQRLESVTEGSVTFTLFRGTGEVRHVVLAENEAVKGNPLCAALIGAFRKAEADATGRKL